MNRHFIPLLWLGCAALATADVSAQAPVQPAAPQPPVVRRPYRGLFAQPSVPKPGRSTVDVRLDALGAYDDDLYAAPSGSVTPGLNITRGGSFFGTSGQVQVERPGEHVSVGAVGGGRLSRHSGREDLVRSEFVVSDVAFTPNTRWRFNAGMSFVDAPQYQFDPFAVGPVVSAADAGDAGAIPADAYQGTVPDFDLQRLNSYRTEVHGSGSRLIGNRSSIEARYSLQVSNYRVDAYDYRSQTGGARFVQRISRDASLKLGYFYEGSRYVNQAAAIQMQPLHNIEAGVDYGRALSFSRRTRVAFSTGSTITQRSSAAGQPAGQVQGWVFNVIGSAALTHEMGRTWIAEAGYFRSQDFREGFLEPFLSNTATVSLSGLVSRRLRFRTSAVYTLGNVGVDTDNGYNTRSARAEAEYALSRVFAISGRYVYYAYDFDNRVSLDPRFLQNLNRQGVRLGVIAYIPVTR